MEARTPARSRIPELIRSTEIISRMMSREQIEVVLAELERTLDADVPGAVVEFGCNCGTTSVFIAALLEQRGESREYHVYDSFKGLPPARPGDLGAGPELPPGTFAMARAEFTGNLERAGIARIPSIHEGLFEDLGAKDVPDEICWAFLDGDLYQSILTSLELVYPRLAPGGAMVVDDYGWTRLPGVERACSDFLADKPETPAVFREANVAVVVRRIEDGTRD
jgi:O-methyltransferase